jgi:hypothetical protein
MSLLIVTLLVWVLAIPVAVVSGAYALGAMRKRRLIRANRAYARSACPLPGTLLRLPVAERSSRSARGSLTV